MSAPLTCPAAAAHEQDKNEYNWRGALEDLRGAYADTTIHGYARDFALFVTWCNAQGCCPLPASPQTLARYLDDNIATLRATTLVRRLAAIVRVHRLLELDDPADSERVRPARRRIQRHRPNRPRQALGIDRELRGQLLSACPDSLAGKRDKTLVALGFEGLCRRSELAALRSEDVVENRHSQLALLIRRGKADQNGDGRVVTLSEATAGLLLDWIAAAGIEDGPLIRPVYRGTVLARHMAGFSTSRLLKSIARRAGIDPTTVMAISGHSLRVGAAQTLLGDGYDLLRLMKAGGWKSATTVLRYVDRTEIDVWR